MSKQRTYLYVLYGLLLGGIAGKLIGWITLTHNIFFDWVTEGMIFTFFVLEAKTIFAYFNPGVRVPPRIQSSEHIYSIAAKPAWLLIGIAIRILGILFFSFFAFLFFTEFRHVEYFWASLCIYFAVLLIVGIFFYVKNNPYVMLIDEKGILVYFFSLKKIPWQKLESVKTKADWIALQPSAGSVQEIEFENLLADRNEVISQVRAQAIIRNISYQDGSGEFTPELWE